MPPRFSIADILTSPAGEGFFNGFHARVYDRGAMIGMGDGDENGVFVVMDGKIRVYLISEEREFTLFYLLPGDMFCMHSGCLIEAVEKSDLRLADIKTFSHKIEQCPEIAFGVISILGRGILSCMKTIEDLMFHDIKQRIAWFFVDLADTEEQTDGVPIDLSVGLTIEEIANLIGSSRQTTSTAFNNLIKRGLLARKSRADYAILDLDGLRTVAAGRDPDTSGPRVNEFSGVEKLPH